MIFIDVESDNRPISNYVLIVLTVFLSLIYIISSDQSEFQYFLDNRWNPIGIVLRLFIQPSFFNLIFSVIFIYTFGNAVCSTIGNNFYLVVYILLGVICSVAYQIFFDDYFIGSRASVTALTGMVFMWFPNYEVQMVAFIGFSIQELRFKVKHLAMFYIVMSVIAVFNLGIAGPFFISIFGLLLGLLLAFSLISLRLVYVSDPLVNFSEKKHGESSFKERSLSESKERGVAERLLIKHDQQIIEEHQLEKKYMILERKEAFPIFRIIKIDKVDGGIKCFIVNDGDSVLNIKVDADFSDYIVFEPADNLKNGDTGIIKFSGAITNKNEFTFKLSYNNEIRASEREFKCVFSDKIIKAEKSKFDIE